MGWLDGLAGELQVSALCVLCSCFNADLLLFFSVEAQGKRGASQQGIYKRRLELFRLEESHLCLELDLPGTLFKQGQKGTVLQAFLPIAFPNSSGVLDLRPAPNRAPAQPAGYRPRPVVDPVIIPARRALAGNFGNLNPMIARALFDDDEEDMLLELGLGFGIGLGF